MERHVDMQSDDSNGPYLQAELSPVLCSSQSAAQSQISCPGDPLKSSTSASTSPTNYSITVSGPISPVPFGETSKETHCTLQDGTLGSLSPISPSPGSQPTSSSISGSVISHSLSSQQQQSPSPPNSNFCSPHLVEVDRQPQTSQGSGQQESQTGEHCVARNEGGQTCDEACQRGKPAAVYTFHTTCSSAEYDVDDVSVEASGVDDGAREHGTDEPRQRSPPQLGNEDGTWALGQNEEMGTARLQQEITDLAGQVNVLVGMVLEAKSLEIDLQEAQERCIFEVAAVKESIRSEAEACSKAVDQVLQARQGNGSPGKDPGTSDSSRQASATLAQSSPSLSRGPPDCNLEPCCSPACSADRMPSQVNRSLQDTASLCSRIAVLEAEVAAQRLTAEAAWRSNSVLTSRLSDLLGTATGAQAASPSSELHSPPCRPPLLPNDLRSRTLCSVGLAGPDHQLHGDTSSDNLHYDASRAPAVACEASWSTGSVGTLAQIPTGSPGQKRMHSSGRVSQTHSGQVQPLPSPTGDQREHCNSPGQLHGGMLTPALRYAATLLREEPGDSDRAQVAGRAMGHSTSRRAATVSPACLGGWRSPSFRHASKLPPALEGLPPHMHRYAPPSILAELAPVASPSSEAAHAPHTCPGTGSHLAQRFDAKQCVVGHAPVAAGFVRSPFGSIMGSSAQHAQASM